MWRVQVYSRVGAHVCCVYNLLPELFMGWNVCCVAGYDGVFYTWWRKTAPRGLWLGSSQLLLFCLWILRRWSCKLISPELRTVLADVILQVTSAFPWKNCAPKGETCSLCTQHRPSGLGFCAQQSQLIVVNYLCWLCDGALTVLWEMKEDHQFWVHD